MANSGSWVSHVEGFMDTSRPSSQQIASLDAVASLVKKDFLTLAVLVREMELYLTTSDHLLRARGILFLAEIISRLTSKRLDNSIICSVTEFFTSRLADWHALRGALLGCLALLRRTSDAGAMVESSARALAKSFIMDVQVQSLAVHDRKLCFEVFQCLLDVYPKAVAELGDELVYFVCDAIDEEKDPRCLLLTFHLVESVLHLFHNQESVLDSFAQDLFDILGRYFPIYFTHPGNEDLGITRDALSTALMHAFCSTQVFEPFAIPLLLDKLSSDLSSAKLDSLKYLNKCMRHYGAERMAKHSKPVWSAVKDVIFNFAAHASLATPNTETDENMTSLDCQVFREALLCLQTAILHLNSPNEYVFLSLVLEDKDVEAVFGSVCDEKLYRGISRESDSRLTALGSILSVSSKVSTNCCSQVFQKFFTPLMNILGVSAGTSGDNCLPDYRAFSKNRHSGAVFLCVEILSSCRDLAVSMQKLSQEFVPVDNSWFGILGKFSGPLSCSFGSMLLTRELAQVTVDDSILDLFRHGVKGLQVLSTFPGSYSSVSDDIFKDILVILLSIIMGMFDDFNKWNLSLNALVQIGLFIEENHDPMKEVLYHNIVVERIISLLLLSDSAIPFALRLDAILEIGKTGMKVMLPVTHDLDKAVIAKLTEACVEGNLLSADILVTLLKSYSNKVLPWCGTTSCFEEVSLRFAINVWTWMEEEKTFNADMPMQVQDILDSLMMGMKLAVSGCSKEAQASIIVKAYNVLLSSGSIWEQEQKTSISNSEVSQLSADLNGFSNKEEWLVSLFASVVIALRPETPIPDVKSILTILLRFLQKGTIPAAQALASILNKWPENSNFVGCSNIFPLGIVAEVFSVLDLSSCFQVYTVNGLAWIGKGLLMRGHEKVREVAMFFLKCLLSNQVVSTLSIKDESEDGHENDEQTLFALSAADAFHVLLSNTEACLDKKFHATIKPLYKQRFFSTMMPILLASIKESTLINTRSLLYRALGHIISDTPLPAVIGEGKQVIPSLLDAIGLLSANILNRDVIYSLLLVLSSILIDENGKEAVVENLRFITTTLVKLISYAHMMVVRETALQCLVAVTMLPHAKVYPLRPQVLQSVTKALDDSKMAVRKEAVRCHQAWASIASRSLP